MSRSIGSSASLSRTASTAPGAAATTSASGSARPARAGQPAEDLARVRPGRAHRQPGAALAARKPPRGRLQTSSPALEAVPRQPALDQLGPDAAHRHLEPLRPARSNASAGPASPGPQARNTRLKFRFIPEIVGL